ncbi:Flp pilus assembly protein CpaB [Nocardioides massiliensis]|uniref:Pilus assembly protein CpaB n=1 Tax=Nocardioides massiliensis TaxID=1325935 RepID=A0ABT9NTQ3_9ACTN|nr:Flp pilus assembly protein CpaB [Nocardioides massiliensis]MDP9823559.1 pilus assembly protein CpaB [Nocardioides massiliensis]
MDRRRVLLIVAAAIAAVGTLLVFLYVRSVDERANEQFDAVSVLRAVDVIAAGESIEAAQAAGKLEMGTVSRNAVLDGARTNTDGMTGSVALTTIYPGEQILDSRFGTAAATEVLTIPEGMMAISVNLSDPARVAGFVNPGAEVSIFLTAQNGPQGAYTRMLLPRVTVIGVGTTSVVPTTTTDGSGGQTTEQLPRTLLTLALTQKQAEKVLFGSTSGELAFGLLTEDSEVTPGPGVDVRNLF